VSEGWVNCADYIAKTQELHKSFINQNLKGKNARSTDASARGSKKKCGSNSNQHDDGDSSTESEELPEVHEAEDDSTAKTLLMLSTSSILFAPDAPVTAQHLIDFCCDVQDFRRIPRCGFQYFHASHIFESYIMYGASKRVCNHACNWIIVIISSISGLFLYVL
jgi:hypothetical protein